jgi:alkylation response protein AidB-like acyl-CoA dehydrogenase
MDTSWTPELEELREEVREFALKEITPIATEHDNLQKFPMDVAKKMGERGYLGIIFPKELGGRGLGYKSYVIIVEEISRVDGSMGITVAAHNSLCSNHIYSFASEEQKKKYMPQLTGGATLGFWGLTEPNAGSDAGGTQTTAVLDGDEWVLNGSKTFITHGGVGDIGVVLASTDKSLGNKGISAFIIERSDEGFATGNKEHKLGLRASDTTELVFDDCRLPKERLVGELNRGFIDTLKVLDGGRISIGALGLGLAQGALDCALEYAKDGGKFQGGLVKDHQGLKHMIVDMATEVHAARLLLMDAADTKDRGERVTIKSAMGKMYAAEVGMRNATKAVQILGSMGLSQDSYAERIFRDVKLCEIGEGTSEVQRLVIARMLGL